MRSRLPVLCVALLALISAPVLGFVPEPNHGLEIPLPEFALVRSPHASFASRVTEPMAERYGGRWHIGQWNQFSHTPQSLYGSGVELAPGGLTSDPIAADIALEFIRANEDILGALESDLVLDAVVRGGDKVGVHFQQRYHGIPVIGGLVSTVSLDTGRLYYASSAFHRDIAINPVPSIGSVQAQSIATDAVGFDRAADTVDGAPELHVLPIPLAEGGSSYHLVWRVRVQTVDPFAIWVSHVDAHTGEVVYRFNDVHSVFAGTMEGDVDNTGYCDGFATLPFREMTVTVLGAGTTVTASDGSWSVSGAGDRTLTAEFDGPQQNVVNMGGLDAMIAVPVSDDLALVFDWNDGNSDRAERDCFYWVNETDAFVKGIDPAYNHPKYTCNVNIGNSCNANWGGNIMNFFQEGGGCANTAHIGDVMAHEFGHGVQSDLLGQQGSEGLGEGNGDILGTYLVEDTIIGRGFNLGNCVSGIRDCDNNFSYPDDVVGQEIHFAGQTICGFNWDARLELEASLGASAGRALSAEIWHFARKISRPTNQPDQVLAYFVYDDDDGDITNGTPHHQELCAGAAAHGFECPEILTGVLISHPGVQSTTDHVSPIDVDAHIVSTEGTIVSASMFYQIENGGYIEQPLVDQGADIYHAQIPAQPTDVDVEYYIVSADDVGNDGIAPEGAPATTFQFSVVTLIDDLETGVGWVAGAPDDDAHTGHWELADPVGTLAQPGEDHTPDPGRFAFITGNCPPGCGLSENDVDNGKTTLFSPVWDLSGLSGDPILRYFRWYSNNTAGNPNTDDWVVDVSNDGGATWTSVENVRPPAEEQNVWLEVAVDLNALFGAANLVQLRFIASDEGGGSIVEAAVDDVVIVAATSTSGLSESSSPASAVTFTVHEARPNPFNPSTTVAFDVAEQGRVRMDVFDASGRLVRTLVDDVVEPGSHSVRWDGRSESGAIVSSGVYHVRAAAGADVHKRKLVLLK